MKKSTPANGILIPWKSADRLWHLGELKRSQKYRHGTSLEGNLLSVSVTPNAWRQIAKLGGLPAHQSTQPVMLVDVLAALHDRAYRPLRQLIEQFGQDRGLLTPTEIFRATFFDEDWEEDRFMEFATREQAIAEIDGRVDDPEDAICAITVLAPTQALRELHNLRQDAMDGTEYALIEWVREHAEALTAQAGLPAAGVYWDEVYDPNSYSAPRGGVFEPNVLKFELAKIPTHDGMTLHAIKPGTPFAFEPAASPAITLAPQL